MGIGKILGYTAIGLTAGAYGTTQGYALGSGASVSGGDIAALLATPCVGAVLGFGLETVAYDGPDNESEMLAPFLGAVGGGIDASVFGAIGLTLGYVVARF